MATVVHISGLDRRFLFLGGQSWSVVLLTGNCGSNTVEGVQHTGLLHLPLCVDIATIDLDGLIVLKGGRGMCGSFQDVPLLHPRRECVCARKNTARGESNSSCLQRHPASPEEGAPPTWCSSCHCLRAYTQEGAPLRGTVQSTKILNAFFKLWTL